MYLHRHSNVHNYKKIQKGGTIIKCSALLITNILDYDEIKSFYLNDQNEPVHSTIEQHKDLFNQIHNIDDFSFYAYAKNDNCDAFIFLFHDTTIQHIFSFIIFSDINILYYNYDQNEDVKLYTQIIRTFSNINFDILFFFKHLQIQQKIKFNYGYVSINDRQYNTPLTFNNDPFFEGIFYAFLTYLFNKTQRLYIFDHVYFVNDRNQIIVSPFRTNTTSLQNDNMRQFNIIELFAYANNKDGIHIIYDSISANESVRYDVIYILNPSSTSFVLQQLSKFTPLLLVVYDA